MFVSQFGVTVWTTAEGWTFIFNHQVLCLTTTETWNNRLSVHFKCLLVSFSHVWCLEIPAISWILRPGINELRHDEEMNILTRHILTICRENIIYRIINEPKMISKCFTKYFLFFGVYLFTCVFMLQLKNENDLICRTAQAVVLIIDYSVDYCWNAQRICFS